MRSIWLIPLVVLVSGGCSSGPSGDYGGEDCGLYDKLTFRDNGKVYISMKMFGMQMGETAGDYIIDEDRIIVTANNQSTVFTLNDDGDLESSMLGEKIICRKGGSSGTAAESTSTMSNSLSASYGGMACMLDKLTFSDDGKVDLYIDDEQESGTYIKDGDQVTVTGKGGSVEFTLVGDNLESTFDGQRAVCSKL
jgi:hypothetical protein